MGAFVRFLGQINLSLTIGLVIGFIFADFSASKKEGEKNQYGARQTMGSRGPGYTRFGFGWRTILQHAEAGKD